MQNWSIISVFNLKEEFKDMPRKLTLEEVNAVLKPRGFKLLGDLS